jgi:hypothetical protein
MFGLFTQPVLKLTQTAVFLRKTTPSVNDISLCILQVVFWMRRAGIPSHPNSWPTTLLSVVDATSFLMHSVVSVEMPSHLRTLVNTVRRLAYLSIPGSWKLVVIALDNSETRLKLARHNAHIYGLSDRIEFVLTDYISFAHSYLALPRAQRRPIDVVFLSPPWGGPGYIAGPDLGQGIGDPEYHLGSMLPLPGDDLWGLSRQITKNIAFYLPRNVCVTEVGYLIRNPAHTSRLREAGSEDMHTGAQVRDPPSVT